MKYYSEYTQSIYDSVEALQAAEANQKKQKEVQDVLVNEYCALLEKITVTMKEFLECADKVEETVTDEVLIQKIAKHTAAMMNTLLPEIVDLTFSLGI